METETTTIRAEKARRTFARLALALLMATSLTACATRQILSETLTTIDMFGRHMHERASFLGASTAVFYPDGVPERMVDLPQLDEKQRKDMEADLQRQANLLVGTLTRNTALMSSALGLSIASVGPQIVNVEQKDAPLAGLEEDGSITIDTRVVQAVYRGILLSVAGELDGVAAAAGSPSEAAQKNALREVIQARTLYLSASPNPTLNTTQEVIKSVRGGSRSTLDVAADVFGAQLQQFGAMMLSMKASDSYDDALGFILGHELGHRALGHYDRLKAGEPRKTLESEADRFGALLVVVARNERVSPNWGYPVPPPGRGYYQFFGGPYCLSDHNYKPSGHTSFFKYGYSLAGFDSLGDASAAEAYAPVAERAVATRRVTEAAFKFVDAAQEDLGTCLMDSKERATFRRDPAARFNKRLASLRKSLAEVDDLSKYGWSASDIAEQRTNLEDMVSEPLLSEKVYLSFFERMTKR